MLVAGILVAAAVVTGVLQWQARRVDPDDLHIAAERSRRLVHARTGSELAGTPDLARLEERLDAQKLRLGAPVFIRIFKREFELELWIENGARYQLFATYPICRWSGRLGPKLAEGDHQSPEGFYSVDARALNPRSRWHRSFNLGFPNAFDKAHGRSGSFLMVHGGCSSVGCYAMTNPVIDEIWRLLTAALRRGQSRVQVHVFPFRMTEEALAARRDHASAGFWRQLKDGYDAFASTSRPPLVAVCRGRYLAVAATTARLSTSAAVCPPDLTVEGAPAADRL